MLAGNVSVEAAILRSRALLRHDRTSEAISELNATAPSLGQHRLSAEHRITISLALIKNGRYESAAEAITEADVYATFVKDPELTGEVEYAKAFGAFAKRDYAETNKIAFSALDPRAPIATGRLLGSIALVAGLSGNHLEQISYFQQSIESLQSAPQRDYYLEAHALNNLAIPAAELNPMGVREFIAAKYESIAWDTENATLQSLILQHLAWLDALHGDHLSAFGRFRQASRLSSDNSLRALALIGRAFLAREMDELLTAAECLADAHSFITDIDQTGAAFVETSVLLGLASLTAYTDVARASALLDTYAASKAQLDSSYIAAHANPINQAVEFHAYGLVAVAKNELDDGIARLRDAHKLFISIGSTWRAAIVALDIYDITHEDDMLVFAREQAARVPHSWLARRLSQTIPPPVLYKDVVA